MEFDSKHNLRIMTYNVQGFKKYDSVIELIKKSDAEIIGLNEALFFTDELRTKFTTCVTSMGYNIKMCNTYGINVILSKYPIIYSKVIKLCKDPIKNRNRYALHVTIMSINIILTHLDAFDNDITSNQPTRLKQIIEIGQHIKPDFILMGDFNSERGSDVVNLIETSFIDSFRILNKELPSMTSWTGRTIDFIFIGKFFPYKIINTSIYYSSASDHYPVYVDI